MKRRDLIKKGGITVGAVTLGTGTATASDHWSAPEVKIEEHDVGPPHTPHRWALEVEWRVEYDDPDRIPVTGPYGYVPRRPDIIEISAPSYQFKNNSNYSYGYHHGASQLTDQESEGNHGVAAEWDIEDDWTDVCDKDSNWLGTEIEWDCPKYLKGRVTLPFDPAESGGFSADRNLEVNYYYRDKDGEFTVTFNAGIPSVTPQSQDDFHVFELNGISKSEYGKWIEFN